ncbi:hypothetical protein EVAR_47336_1 [Eumeta japonica]|uniref:Uncharacterized protein n=1 Tax=Eumeta variegata TaxID=151549 RepID=A0A4C1WWH0_EUMVA|nr:hypothetical protein EVAR_47336_1 [Eumeta japonica]
MWLLDKDFKFLQGLLRQPYSLKVSRWRVIIVNGRLRLRRPRAPVQLLLSFGNKCGRCRHGPVTAPAIDTAVVGQRSYEAAPKGNYGQKGKQRKLLGRRGRDAARSAVGVAARGGGGTKGGVGRAVLCGPYDSQLI